MNRRTYLDEHETQIYAWHDEGASNREIARRLSDQLGYKIDEKLIRRRIGFRARERVAAGLPPCEIVPDGFHLSSVSTTVHKDGTRSQSYRAKSGEEGDVVPEGGTFPAPDGLYVNAVSTLVDGQTGAVKQQWVKAKAMDDRRAQVLEAAARALAEKLVPLEPVPRPEFTNEDLCSQYTITDSHVGMLAWSRETGEKWDLDIAEDLLVTLFTRMIGASPVAATGIINQQGDFLHFDSLVPLTPTSGNQLDADSRYQKVVEVAVRVLRRIITAALQKHQRVLVYMHEGNHDMAGSVWLRILFSALYENEPRVTVCKSPLPYVAYQHGTTMLCYHHGHLSKNESLPLLFAARFPEIWGSTTKRYINTGHRHHVEEKEHPGIKVIQHPTLAAADAFSARSGYYSERQASCITFHKKYGEVGRTVWTPEMVGHQSRRTDL